MNTVLKSILIMILAALLVACGVVAEPTLPAEPAATEAPQEEEEAKAEETAKESTSDQEVLSGEDLEALIAAAEAEGKVVAYSFTSRIAKVEKAFEEAYPNIDLVGFDISSTEQIARIKSEQEAGAHEADIAYISDAPVVLGELVQEGILQPYVPPQFADRALR